MDIMFKLQHDNFTRIARKKKARGATEVYVSSKERKEIVENIGDAAALLYIFYVEKSGVESYDYADAKAANALSWKPTKVQRTRLALTKSGWFKQVTLTNNTTKQKATITYLGKEMNAKVLTPEEYTHIQNQREEICNHLGIDNIYKIHTDPELHAKALDFIRSK